MARDVSEPLLRLVERTPLFAEPLAQQKLVGIRPSAQIMRVVCAGLGSRGFPRLVYCPNYLSGARPVNNYSKEKAAP